MQENSNAEKIISVVVIAIVLYLILRSQPKPVSKRKSSCDFYANSGCTPLQLEVQPIPCMTCALFCAPSHVPSIGQVNTPAPNRNTQIVQACCGCNSSVCSYGVKSDAPQCIDTLCCIYVPARPGVVPVPCHVHQTCVCNNPSLPTCQTVCL